MRIATLISRNACTATSTTTAQQDRQTPNILENPYSKLLADFRESICLEVVTCARNASVSPLLCRRVQSIDSVVYTGKEQVSSVMNDWCAMTCSPHTLDVPDYLFAAANREESFGVKTGRGSLHRPAVPPPRRLASVLRQAQPRRETNAPLGI